MTIQPLRIRHPLPLLTKETRPLDIRPDNVCLLVQDVHSPFTDAQDGWLASRARDKVLMREFEEYFFILNLISPNFPRILAAVRELSITVVFSSLGHHASDVASPFQEAMGWDWNLDESVGTFQEAWLPQKGELVLSKPGWSALGNPSFERTLSEKGITNVLVIGTMLDFGIRQTCVDLSDRGIGSLIVSDGVVAMTKAGQEYTSDSIAHGLIKLRTAGETLGLLNVLGREGSVLI